MKSVILALVITAFYAVDGIAQTTEEINIIQSLYGMQKRELLMSVMKLSPSDSVSFWPLYDQYEDKRKDLGKKRIEMIKNFVSKYPAISSEEIDDTIEDVADLQEDMSSLMMDYFKKIRKATSSMVAAKFYQTEMYLHTAIQADLQNKLPFIGEFSVKAKK